eukprot:tig00000681_g3111.t1
MDVHGCIVCSVQLAAITQVSTDHCHEETDPAAAAVLFRHLGPKRVVGRDQTNDRVQSAQPKLGKYPPRIHRRLSPIICGLVDDNAKKLADEISISLGSEVLIFKKVPQPPFQQIEHGHVVCSVHLCPGAIPFQLTSLQPAACLVAFPARVVALPLDGRPAPSLFLQLAARVVALLLDGHPALPLGIGLCPCGFHCKARLPQRLHGLLCPTLEL